MLVLALAKKVQSQSIDFTLAYPQVDLDVDIYLELPHSFRLDGFNKKDFLLNHKNLYGLKQA
jgi:hypothetical protein